MRPAVKRMTLLCVALVLHDTISLCRDSPEEAEKIVCFPQKALQVYRNLINKAQADHPECTLSHPQSYETLKKSIDDHWRACLNNESQHGILPLLECIKVEAKEDMEVLLYDVKELLECLNSKEDTYGESSDWAEQVTEVKMNLPAVKKNNEFYVTIENAKLANRTRCYAEFYPLVDEYTASIDQVVDNCAKFVPAGNLDEFRECCEDLTQPIFSDIEAKLLHLNNCWA